MTTLRAAARGWLVFVPVIVVHAVVQAVLIVADPVPAFTFGFSALVVASLVALLIAMWLTVGGAAAAVAGEARRAVARAWAARAVPAWLFGIGVVATGALLVEYWLAPLVLVAGGFLLPAAAAGERNAFVGFDVVRRAPWRSALLVLVAVVLLVLSWIVALVLGLFLTGVLAAMLTWVWFGAVSTLLLCRWCALYAATRAVTA